MKTPQLLILFFVLCIVLVGCGQDKTTSSNTTSTPATGDIMNTSTWDSGVSTRGGASALSSTKRADQFAIVVATFTGSASKESAVASMRTLAQQYPTLGRGLSIRDRARGTALTFGLYTGYQDPKAKKDMSVLRAMKTTQGKALFGQVLLLKFKPPRDWANLHPHDLWTVRRQYPTMVPLFTLEVAVWGDFESGQFPKSRRHATAQRYAAELRRMGFEAFFHHNDEGELSSVTVGLFGPNALDPETGFYSPEVEALLSRFPERLVNGQQIQMYFDPNNHALGSRVQQPSLAEIPLD